MEVVIGMMSERDAIVEILQTACSSGKDCSTKNCFECLADYLVAHGKHIVSDSTSNVVSVECNFYDKEETFENCTVQVLTNTVTGEVSVGWWKTEV